MAAAFRSSRRAALKTGLAAVAPLMAVPVEQPGEARVLFLVGDYWHNPIMHTKVQPAHIHQLNLSHPITQRPKPFDIGDDEIFNAELKPGQSTLLFRTSGEEEKVDAVGGWCREEGKGRAVVLLPGHIPTLYMVESYKKILWRSAHWALKGPMGPEDHIKGSY
ncbi:MAG: ThuA domain-containing protein [Bryobacteraceae bacterium]